MSLVTEYSLQAEFALAAYANLQTGTPDVEALQNDGDGMSPTQAAEFASRWRVVDQYAGVVSEEVPTYDDGGNLTGYATIQRSTGLSVTLFEEIGSGRQVVAVRGTTPTDLRDLATDIIDILVLGSSEAQAQYAALRDQVARWLAPGGPLQAGFTVTGHSLGGFLAGALLADFRQQIDHAYLYNAPGVGGATGSLAEAIGLLVGHPVPVVDATKITSLRADAGPSPVAGLGADWAVPIAIHIEDQSPTLTGNHDMRLLTDSLALHDLIARLDPTIETRGVGGVGLVGELLKSASPTPERTLEAALDAIHRALFPDTATPTPIDQREDLHAKLTSLNDGLRDSAYNQGSIEAPRYAFTITSLAGFTAAALEFAARENLAYRYALKELNPFAILGFDYSTRNDQGKLDLYDPQTGEGHLSEAWIADRAGMLSWTIRLAIEDRPAATAAQSYGGLGVAGEAPSFKAPGQQQPITHGPGNLSEFDLHSGTLPTALLPSDGLRWTTGAYVDLGNMLFDKSLYYRGSNTNGRAAWRARRPSRTRRRNPQLQSDGRNARSPLFHQRGAVSGLSVFLTILLLIPVLTVAFYVGRKAYWDSEVREMCAKDGGVVIYHAVDISPQEADALPRVGGFLGVSPEALAAPSEPVLSRTKETLLNSGALKVIRYETQIIRRTDGLLIATAVSYVRSGGDLPTYGFPSSLFCPDQRRLNADIAKIFQLRGVSG